MVPTGRQSGKLHRRIAEVDEELDEEELVIGIGVTPHRVSVAPTIIEHPPRPIHLYRVTDDDLTLLSQPFGSMAFGIASTFLGAAIAVGITLATVSLETTAKSVLVGSLVASIGVTLLAGIEAARDLNAARRRVQEIREQREL